MSEFLNSVKEDLTDRRLLPLVAAVVLALVGAVAYAVLSGGSHGTPTAAVSPAPASPQGLSPTPTQPSAAEAVAETTNGASSQRRGSAHDPFTELPGSGSSTTVAVVASTSKTSSSSSSAATAAGSSGGNSKASSEPSSKPSAESKPAPSSKPQAPAKPKTVYRVAAEFGAIPAGAVPNSTQLQAYAGLTKATPIPSAKDKIVEFIGVTVSGTSRSATFALTGEVILNGTGACLPSATQCKMVDLKEGKSEQLEYISASGQPVVYELRVVSIASSSASSATVKSVFAAQSRVAHELSLAGLHFSAQVGVLAFVARRPHAGAAGRR